MAVVLTLLKQLQLARKTTVPLDEEEATANLSLCVMTARGVLTEMATGDDWMQTPLLKWIVDAVRTALAATQAVEAKRAALEACVELALVVRRLKDRSQEQAALVQVLTRLEGTAGASSPRASPE